MSNVEHANFPHVSFRESSGGINPSREHLEFLQRVHREKIRVRLTQFIILFIALALWEILANARIIDPFITSQPSRVLKTILQLYREGVLFQHIGVTCLETIIGFVLGTF